MIDRLAEARRRYDELTAEFASPGGALDSRRLASVGREMAQLEQSARLHDDLSAAQARVDEARELLESPDLELAELAREENGRGAGGNRGGSETGRGCAGE